MKDALSDLLDDLTPEQLRQVILDHYIKQFRVTRSTLKNWRRAHNLPVAQ